LIKSQATFHFTEAAKRIFMEKVLELETDFGIEMYASQGPGIGGKIRVFPEDFVVEEMLVDGSKASVNPLDMKALSSGHGRYVVCVLIKKSWDTFAAVRAIAKKVDVDPDRVSIAGIKDARALTAQHISLGGVSIDKVLGIHLEDATVIPTHFSSDKISSKVLFGNQFDITVRSVNHSTDVIKQRIGETWNCIKILGGVPNFFGHQRFGTIRPFTHRIGRCIVKSKFEEAALIFLSEPSVHEHRRSARARERLRETRDYRDCLRFFPRRLVYERLMMVHLTKYPNDFLGAFRRIPRNLRVFFVQAYQSYLFNRFLSERMKCGLSLNEAYPGDYVVSLDKKGSPMNSFRKTGPDEVSAINEAIGKKELAVALPLVGYRQGLSGGGQEQIETNILEEEGVQAEDFHLREMPEASAEGRLRNALSSILDFDYKVKEDKNDQNRQTVRFRFMLHKGSYATVVLREFIKSSDLIEAGF
jgi:tRNA pseudouridine13 synthase